MPISASRNAAPRYSAIRKNRSFANELSMITISSPQTASLPNSARIPSRPPAEAGRVSRGPRGSRTRS